MRIILDIMVINGVLMLDKESLMIYNSGFMVL